MVKQPRQRVIQARHGQKDIRKQYYENGITGAQELPSISWEISLPAFWQLGPWRRTYVTGARAAPWIPTQIGEREKIILTASSLPPVPLISQIFRKPESKRYRKCDLGRAEKEQVIGLRKISKWSGQVVSCCHLSDREFQIIYLFRILLKFQ